MTDYRELMRILSIPRPNGSAAERETKCQLLDWLTRYHIPHRVQAFRIYPYFFECIGIWLNFSRSLLAIAVWAGWGWLTLPVALFGLLGGTLDIALHIPLVTWPGAMRAENILLQFEPAHPQQEILFSAHYDSRTELLDHSHRIFFLKKLRLGIVLTLILGFWGILLEWSANSAWYPIVFWIGTALVILLLFLAWGLGLHLSLGRYSRPSQGAVDNGAACAILLGLAGRLATGQIPLMDKKITIALFTGEEANMQGSRAYVHNREWPLPTAVVNLEVMGQDGDSVYWQQDGSVFHLMPTASWLNETLAGVIVQVTGKTALPAGPINSDGFSFLDAGIPATTIGTVDTRLGLTGFHRPSDNIDRVIIGRLPRTVEILEKFLNDVHFPQN